MKILFRSLSVILILSLLLCLSVFAYNRTVYKKTSKRYYMAAKGQDKIQGGSEKAYASARLDLDYIGEDGGDENYNRFECFSYASVGITRGSGGTYSISAAAYMIYNSESNDWRWFIYRGIDADVILNYDPNNFDVSDIWAKDYFYMVGANAQLTNSQGVTVEGHARDFSHGEPTTWVCLDEDGDSNHGPDETCIVCDSNITE